MNRIAHAALAALALTVAAFVIVRSGRAPTTAVTWTEGYPDRLLYEAAPAVFFPTGRTSARGNRLDVAFSDGASIRVELAPDESAAAALARTWFDEGSAAAAHSSAADDVYTFATTKPPARAQIVHVGRAAIRVAVTRDDDPAYLLGWIPGLQRTEVEDGLAAVRRERPAVFWGAIALAVALSVGSLCLAVRNARRAASASN